MQRNAGDTPTKALVLNTPAGLEEFIEEGGQAARDSFSPPTPSRRGSATIIWA